MKTFTRPGFDRDDLPVLSSIALSGPGRVNNDLGTRRGFSMGSKPGRYGSPEERFWRKVNKDGPVPTYAPHLGPCWLWTAHTNGKVGYGYFAVSPERRKVGAHRFAFELLVGSIPEGLELDHLCRVPLCVNPAHLEPVTSRENQARGNTFTAINIAKTHCPQGHPYAGENLKIDQGKRKCRTCVNAYLRKLRASPRTPLDTEHGRASTYRHLKCRCDACRAAVSLARSRK